MKTEPLPVELTDLLTFSAVARTGAAESDVSRMLPTTPMTVFHGLFGNSRKRLFNARWPAHRRPRRPSR